MFHGRNSSFLPAPLQKLKEPLTPLPAAWMAPLGRSRSSRRRCCAISTHRSSSPQPEKKKLTEPDCCLMNHIYHRPLQSGWDIPSRKHSGLPVLNPACGMPSPLLSNASATSRQAGSRSISCCTFDAAMLPLDWNDQPDAYGSSLQAAILIVALPRGEGPEMVHGARAIHQTLVKRVPSTNRSN